MKSTAAPALYILIIHDRWVSSVRMLSFHTRAVIKFSHPRVAVRKLTAHSEAMAFLSLSVYTVNWDIMFSKQLNIPMKLDVTVFMRYASLQYNVMFPKQFNIWIKQNIFQDIYNQTIDKKYRHSKKGYVKFAHAWFVRKLTCLVNSQWQETTPLG